MSSGLSIHDGKPFHELDTCAFKGGSPDLLWVPVKAGTRVKVVKLEKCGSYNNGYYTRVYVKMPHPQTGEEIIADANGILSTPINGAFRKTNRYLKLD
jgi:hypothetical protein